jgi:hypothetical protein
VDWVAEYFKSTVHRAAARYIRQSSGFPRRTPVPWWTEECRDALRSRRWALTQFRAHPTLDNLISFKRFHAKSQRFIREAKQTSRRAFVYSLSRSTRPDVVWDKLRPMSDKYSRIVIPGLSAGGAVLTAQADVASTIASSFWTVCSSDNNDPDFRTVKTVHRPPPSILLFVSLKLVTPSSPWANFLPH